MKKFSRTRKFVNDHHDAFCVAGGIAIMAAGSACVLGLATWTARWEAERQKSISQGEEAAKTVRELLSENIIPDQ